MDSADIELGFRHILDAAGYDHILFVVALCAVYTLKDWKKVLVLVTAFTIGHSLTLALSAVGSINISASFVERLIPITIILTCVFNIFTDPVNSKKSIHYNYLIALIFGLVHGLGFSNFFKSMFENFEEFVLPLLGFNIGLELGQIIVVLVTLLMGYLAVRLGMVQKMWTNMISCIVMIWAIYLMF